MMPSLEDQERIFVNKFVYRLEPIERGDVVVFRYPRDPSKSYIKRVIGMAGDRIRIDGGQVYVNNQALDEDYVPPAYTDSRSYPETSVPEHCFFVLGDHRSMSNDSRDFGPVNLAYVQSDADPAFGADVGRDEEAGGIGGDQDRLLARRRLAPDGKPAVAVVVVQVPDERFLAATLEDDGGLRVFDRQSNGAVWKVVGIG